MELRPQSNEWYDRLARLQRGYVFPWKSTIGPGDGETAYLQLVEQHLTPCSDVLDAGCGHGELTLQLARRCRSILGYDRVTEYIRLAREAAQAAGIINATFVEANSSPRFNGGVARVPAEVNSFDLIVSRRGPTNWIADVRRIARPGVVCIQLNPASHGPPAWAEELPRRSAQAGRRSTWRRRSAGHWPRAACRCTAGGSSTCRSGSTIRGSCTYC